MQAGPALRRHRHFRPWLPLAWSLTVLVASAVPGFVLLLLLSDGGPFAEPWGLTVAVVGVPVLVYAGGGRVARDWVARQDVFPFEVDSSVVRRGSALSGTLATAAPCSLCVVLLVRNIVRFQDQETEYTTHMDVERISLARIARNSRRFDARIPSEVVPSKDTEQIGETSTTYWIRVEPEDGRRPPTWATVRKSDRPIHVLPGSA